MARILDTDAGLPGLGEVGTVHSSFPLFGLLQNTLSMISESADSHRFWGRDDAIGRLKAHQAPQSEEGLAS